MDECCDQNYVRSIDHAWAIIFFQLENIYFSYSKYIILELCYHKVYNIFSSFSVYFHKTIYV
jgi:hypothetical protein